MRERIEFLRGRLPAPPIVLLPGLFAGALIWKAVQDHLSALGYSVLLVLEPFAALHTKSVSFDTLRQLLIGVLDEHKISRAVLCGNSLGGLVALDTARYHPERVDAVVISGSPGLGETANLGPWHRGDMSRRDADRIAEQLFYDPSVIPEEVIEKSFAIVTDRRCAANMLRYVIAIRKYDLRGCLRQIQCEVLMIWGEQDRIAPVDEWEKNLHLIARSSLRKLACCGHSPMIERPAEFNTILAKFMLARG